MSSLSLNLGWNISPQGWELISVNNTITDNNILLKTALNADLREIGLPVLTKELNKSHIAQLVLQIQKIRNVSAPKANEDSQAAPRMLKLTLTDGENYVQAIENSTIPSISRDKTPPGSKLLLSNVKVLNGFLILNQENTKLLGGIVPHLFEKWELAKSVQYCSRPTVASDGPPAWVNFGTKILASGDELKSSDNRIKEQPKENSEFEALRQGAIAVASTGAVKKVFGGGVKQPVQNNNRAKPEFNKGNNRIKKELKNGKDKEIDERPQKPSDKVSLFDFLEDKLNITENVTVAKNKKEETPQNHSTKPAFDDMRNHYNNDKNYTNQKNNYQKKDYNNFNDKKYYNQKEQFKRESNRYQEHKFEMQNDRIMHKSETNTQYNTNKFNPKPFQHKEENSYKKDTNRNQDNFNTKRFGKNETNQTRDSNKFIRNEKERMKDSWHYRAPDKIETAPNTNSNVDSLADNMGKISVNSEFASRSLRQHLNLEGKKPTIQPSNESNDLKRFNVGDHCLVKYWEDGKFYPARITAFTDTTYVVQFKGYGNIEEVLKTDCTPFRSQDRPDEKRYYKGSLEFRRNPRKFTSS